MFSALSPFFVVTSVTGKNVALPLSELAKAGTRFIAHPTGPERGWRWLKLKVFMSIWVRNFFTLAGR